MAREYAFLMINYDMPELIKDIHGKLTEEELYTEPDSNDFGKELDTHVTLVPCLENDIDIEQLKKMLDPIEKYVVMLNNISMFTNNENYDVLKCDAHSMVLSDTNKRIKDAFPTHSDYLDYNPHVTIAYLKKGFGNKYLKEMLSPLIVLQPKQFHFSFVDKNGSDADLYFK